MHVKKENDMKYAKGFRLAMVRAAAVFLLLLPAAPARSSDPGKAVFEQKCAACHAMQPGAKLTVKERLKVKGTPLWFAGSKFRRDWLAAWLTRPRRCWEWSGTQSRKGHTNTPPLPRMRPNR
jgi:mono/diheme cytochrome c family protein